MTGITNSTEERALKLLGDNIPAEQVAHALGVSASRISQLLSNEEFATAVAMRRYENLEVQTKRDSKLDNLEDTIIGMLETSIKCLFQPMQLARVLQIVNAAKRRGAAVSAPGSIGTSAVVTINMPVSIRQQFITNINNQVTTAGDQDLVTIQPKTLLDSLKSRSKIGHESNDRTRDGTGTQDSARAIAA